MANWCRRFVRDCISIVHVLPFHPSTSYEGYAITDYRAVDPRLGSWEDLENLRRDFDLMVDLVLNHCSSSHPWFRQFLRGEEPGRRYFIDLPDPTQPWLKRVYRARNSPLLHPFETASGPRHVWTTYSPDLVDLDWREPEVLLEFLDLLLDSVAHGARIVRLDAFVYLWKEAGTSCVNRPQLHDLLRLMKEVLAGSAALLPSITQVTQRENCAYLEEADLIYNLPLSALLLHSLYSQDATDLRRYLETSPPSGRYLNLAASHDGVGLTWLRDLIPPEAVRRLIDSAVARGALVSSRRRSTGEEELPWEINTTYFSACGRLDRFLATQAVVLALRGVPAIYLPLLLAAQNDYERVRRTGDPRAINRGRFTEPTPIVEGLLHMLRVRRSCAAFHPEAPQRVVDVGCPAVLAVERKDVLCLTNFADSDVTIPRPSESLDLLSGRTILAGSKLTMRPYESMWLCR